MLTLRSFFFDGNAHEWLILSESTDVQSDILFFFEHPLVESKTGPKRLGDNNRNFGIRFDCGCFRIIGTTSVKEHSNHVRNISLMVYGKL